MITSRRKKFISILVVVLALSAVLVACGGDSDESGGKDGDVVITFGMWDKYQEPIMRELADNFEKENPGIKVEFQMTPFAQYWTKLETAATGEVLPDMFWMNGPNIVKYASNDMLLPIEDRIEEDGLDLDLFPEGLVKLYQVEDHTYGIPKDWDATALWYNKELFDENGLDYPTDDWTWDDMIEAARVINDPENGIYGLNARASTQEVIYNTIPQCGGYVINEDRDHSGYGEAEAIDGVQRWVDVIEEGLSPSLEQQADTSGHDLFKAGKVGMIYAASWHIAPFIESEVADHIDLVRMPLIEERAGSIHGLANVISANTEHPDECWEFLKYLASEEANLVWAESGTVIPSRMDTLDIWADVHPDLNLHAYIDVLDYSTVHPVSKNTPVWNDYETEYLNKMWAGEMSVTDAMKELGEKMNEALSVE